MTLCWSFTVFMFSVQSIDFFSRYPHLWGIASMVTLFLFPLLYLFIRAFVINDKRKPIKYFVHFAPAIAYLISFSQLLLLSAEEKIHYLEVGWPDYRYTLDHIFNLIVIIQGIFYSIKSIHILQNFGSTSDLNKLKVQESIVRWLRNFVLIYILLWAIGTVGALLAVLRVDVAINMFYVFYLGLTIMTIRLGYFALKNPAFVMNIKSTTILVDAKKSESEDSSKKTSNEKDVDLMLNYLEKEKAYLKNDLSMQDIVEGTGLSKNRISDLLNSVIGKSFYDILNEYRTKEAIRLINDGKHKSFTITYIAEMAGFNSKATFNRIFKKITNKTPTEYIQESYTNNEDH